MSSKFKNCMYDFHSFAGHVTHLKRPYSVTWALNTNLSGSVDQVRGFKTRRLTQVFSKRRGMNVVIPRLHPCADAGHLVSPLLRGMGVSPLLGVSPLFGGLTAFARDGGLTAFGVSRGLTAFHGMAPNSHGMAIFLSFPQNQVSRGLTGWHPVRWLKRHSGARLTHCTMYFYVVSLQSI